MAALQGPDASVRAVGGSGVLPGGAESGYRREAER
jgi:hypothetical protein